MPNTHHNSHRAEYRVILAITSPLPHFNLAWTQTAGLVTRRLMVWPVMCRVVRNFPNRMISAPQ